MGFSSLREEEEALGRWPRRLLHVKTLTSYKWQPGNIYGTIKEPPYNAISYTWGRYRLKEGDMPEISPLPLKGIEWSDRMPRINPEHFTLAQLMDVLTIASKLSMGLDSDPDVHERKLSNTRNLAQKHGIPLDLDQANFEYPMDRGVEFVWIDVACIDQREDIAESSAEIGRQASIFRGAQTVFIWLCKINQEEATPMFSYPNWWSDSPLSETIDDVHEAINSIYGFLTVLDDPWFSSLWTLQEAYLRGDSVILDKSAQTVSNGPRCLLLSLIKEWGWRAHRYCNIRSKTSSFDPWLPYIREQIQSGGLVALKARNKMALLNAGTYRTTTEPCDRIYGIQQVFGLRLGKTSVEARVGQQYTLQSLQIELAEAILMSEPILSQAHVIMEPIPCQERWSISKHSMVPSPIHVWNAESRAQTKMDRKCRFWVQRPGPETGQVWWSGSTTPLETLSNPSRWNIEASSFSLTCDEDMTLDPLVKQDAWWPRYSLEVFPDVTEEIYEYPHFEPLADTIGRGQQCYRFTKWLIGRYSPARINVLLMGSNSEEGRMQGRGIGLMLLHQHDDVWGRIGICQWWVPKNARLNTQLFQGEGEDWSHGKGIFGYVQSSMTLV